MIYLRPEHEVISSALRGMNSRFLEQVNCFFGGGTAIVMLNGEYRLSLDVDFLCADTDGYREIRSQVRRHGVSALFGPEVQALREFRMDQYGIRSLLSHQGQSIKFEIVRESRIMLDGEHSADFGIPVLSVASQVAEKLLANADRYLDRGVAYRDAIDLGFLVMGQGGLPKDAIDRAEGAYSRGDITHAIGVALDRLSRPQEADYVASTLQMALLDVRTAADRLLAAACNAWPNEFPYDDQEVDRKG